MNPLEWLFATDPQSAMRIQGGNNVPRSVPVPAQRPATRASLPGGSFTPARVPTAQIPVDQVPVPAQRPAMVADVPRGGPQEPPQADMAMPMAQTPSQPSEGPLEALLMGGGSEPLTWKDRVRAFGAGAGAGGSTGGDPFRAFGQGFGGASGYYDARDKAELAKAVELRKMRLSEQLAQNKLKTGGVSYGKSPVWGTDPETGKAVLGVIGDDGSFKKVDTSGVDLSTGTEKIDAGTHWILQDKRSGQFIGTVPKENYQESFDKTKGSEDAKISADAPLLRSKAMSSLDALEQQQSIVIGTIDEALSSIDENPRMLTGFIGNLASLAPGTAAYDLARKLDTVKANIGFDKLQAMREASPTGGALGQVSDTENRLLQAVFGSLDQAQSAQEIKDNLEELKSILAQSKDARRRAFARDFGGEGASSTPSASPEEPSGAGGVIDYTDYFGTE